MDVTLPNGQVIKGVPEGTPKDEIARKAIQAGLAQEADFPELFQAQESEFAQQVFDAPGQVLDYLKGAGALASRIASDIPVKLSAGGRGIGSLIRGEGGLEAAQQVRAGIDELSPEVGEREAMVSEDLGQALNYLAENVPGIDTIIEGAQTLEDITTEIGRRTGGMVADPVGLIEMSDDPQLKQFKEQSEAAGAAIGEAIPETAVTGASLYAPLTAKPAAIVKPAQIKKAATTSMRQAKKLLAEASPSIDRLKSEARNIYNTIDDMGVTIKPDAYRNFAEKTAQALKKQGLDPDISPKANAAVRRMLRDAEGPVTASSLDTLRKVAGNAAKSLEGSDKALGSMMMERIDDFLEGLTPAKTVGGQPKEVGQMFKSARDLWGRAKKSELIGEAIENAKTQNSGFENGLRIQFRSLLRSKKKMRGFTQDEKKLIKQVVDGTGLANLARLGGKFGIDLQQNTNALGAALGAGAGGAAGGPVGAVVIPAIGSVSRGLAEKLTAGSAKLTQDVVRAGKNGNEIVKAYMRAVPKDKRVAADLTELLLKPGVDLKGIRATDPVIKDAVYAVNNFSPEVLASALGLTAQSTISQTGEANQEERQAESMQ